MTSLHRIGLACVLAALGTAASAHDSWLVPAPDSTLLLTTGNRYPLGEFNPTRDSLVASACSDGRAAPRALRPGRDLPTALELKLPAGEPALACWLEMRAYTVEIPPALVQVYFDEVRPPAALRQAWAEMLARGATWRESYRKFARIELPGATATTPAQRASARQPVGLAFEAVVLGDASISAGRAVTFQVLRDGQALAGQPVELVSERSRLGIWRETDAQGRVEFAFPFAGPWLLRSIELQPSGDRPGEWDSRFFTLSFTVVGR